MTPTKPSRAHRKIREKLEGTWEGKEVIHPSAHDPVGGEALARVENRVGLDGFALIQDYIQKREGAPDFRGHAVLTVDPGDQVYRMTWFDSMGQPPRQYRGRFEGDHLKLESPLPQGASRCTFDFSQEGRYGFRLEVSEDEKHWQPYIEGEYERTS